MKNKYVEIEVNVSERTAGKMVTSTNAQIELKGIKVG